MEEKGNNTIKQIIYQTSPWVILSRMWGKDFWNQEYQPYAESEIGSPALSDLQRSNVSHTKNKHNNPVQGPQTCGYGRDH